MVEGVVGCHELGAMEGQFIKVVVCLQQQCAFDLLVEPFNDPVPPGFPYWDEPRYHIEAQRRSEKQTKASWVSVAALEGELVVELQEVGYRVLFPKRDHAPRHLQGALVDNWVNTSIPGVVADDCEQVETLSTSEIAWPYKVHQVHVERLLWILNAAFRITNL